MHRLIKILSESRIVDTIISVDSDELVIRWDNAPHHRKIKTFPHHKHVREEVLESNEVVLEEILGEVEKMIQEK